MPRVRRTSETASRREKAVNIKPLLVKVARTGGTVHEVALNGENTVKAAIDAADLGHGDDDRIRVNGRVADESTKVKDGDIITVAGKIQGGR